VWPTGHCHVPKKKKERAKIPIDALN